MCQLIVSAVSRQRVIEHNLLVVAKYYDHITFARLCELLDLSREEVQLAFPLNSSHLLSTILSSPACTGKSWAFTNFVVFHKLHTCIRVSTCQVRSGCSKIFLRLKGFPCLLLQMPPAHLGKCSVAVLRACLSVHLQGNLEAIATKRRFQGLLLRIVQLDLLV